MKTLRRFPLFAAVTMLILCQASFADEILLEDTFEFFELGETWQEHGDGAPDITLEVGFANDSEVLQMVSSGIDESFLGIETITPISLAGLADVTIDARLRPINQGVEGSVAAAELALIGASGEVIRAFASNNAGPDPESMNDWADHYEDSKGNLDTSGPWPHCDAACDAMRNLVVSVTVDGTTLKAFDDLDDPEFPTWETSFDDFTLADLGSTMTIALRQLTVEDGDNVAGFFDNILVTTSGAAVLKGDFDESGVLDAADIDMLVAESASGENNLKFDVTNDALVNGDDVKSWAKDLRETWLGDANLDGEFSSSDLVVVFQAGKFELNADAVWSQGDWTGDLRFNSSDLVAAFQDGGFEAGQLMAVSSVPEPASAVLTILGALILVCRRR